MVEAYCISPNPNHAIYIRRDDADGDCTDHCLSAETPSALDAPKPIDASCFRSEAEHRQPAYLDYIVLLDFILESRDDDEACVERVAKEKIACKIHSICRSSHLAFGNTYQ